MRDICSEICAKGFLTKDYLTCNHGKCCEFRVICPCIVRKVQSLRHSLYVSWSSLDGLLVCLLWCGFSEFRVIRESCGRIARNLVDSLHSRISRYLLVHCAKGAEFAAFAVCFLEFSGWTPSLLVVVRIQQISRDSRKLWANCAKSG